MKALSKREKALITSNFNTVEMGLDIFSLKILKGWYFPSRDLQAHCPTYLKTNHFKRNQKKRSLKIFMTSPKTWSRKSTWGSNKRTSCVISRSRGKLWQTGWYQLRKRCKDQSRLGESQAKATHWGAWSLTMLPDTYKLRQYNSVSSARKTESSHAEQDATFTLCYI